MHKDLNTVKGGDKAMQELWADEGKTLPILLANKDNSAVLENCVDQSNPSPSEKRAAEISKRGGSHTTMLGGLICRNKDKKKGQQDTYDWYMQEKTGNHVPYPDVSNTRYGSHGDAAATLVVHRNLFVSFMEFVRDAKDKPGMTNIEKNFMNALNDVPTFMELCVLAMYNVNVSRPFMQYVRRHANLLDLESFFQKKRTLLAAISQNPARWTSNNATHTLASLDEYEWDTHALLVMKSVHSHVDGLPDLEGAVRAFTQGALATFSERFSDEFLEGGDVDRLSPQQREELFFPSTNDINEGALGSWRLGQRQRPSETMNKFNAGFLARQNDTEAFLQNKLSTDEDGTYLRKNVRHKDAQKLQKQIREAQMKADAEKIVENHQKESVRKEKQVKKAAAITETGKQLVVDTVVIDRLTVDALNRQLDWHQDNEKNLPGLALSERVPLKSHMTNKAKRVRALKKAIERYQSVPGLNTPVASAAEPVEPVEMGDDSFYHSDYEDNLI